MKRLRYMAIAASMLLAAACHKDNITVVDDTTPSGGGVDIDDVDNIDTNYDRTVNVVFAAQGASCFRACVMLGGKQCFETHDERAESENVGLNIRG